MSKEYELTTIGDIFDKVPADRIRDCCREIGIILAQTKALHDLCVEVAGLERSGKASIGLRWPLIWTDDSKGELTTSIHASDGDEFLRLETKVNNDES